MNRNRIIAGVLREDLGYLLPKSILDVLEEKDSCYSSPYSGKKTYELCDRNSNNSEKSTPSPHVPPLESRLHSYMNKRCLNEDSTQPCNLSKFFNDASLNDEIQNALKTIPQRIKLNKFLKQSNFFQQVKEDIEEYILGLRPKLNILASSFIPDCDKENIFPVKSSSIKY